MSFQLMGGEGEKREEGRGRMYERRKHTTAPSDASMSERAHSNSMLGCANATLRMKAALRKLHTGFGLDLGTKIRAWFLFGGSLNQNVYHY